MPETPPPHRLIEDLQAAEAEESPLHRAHAEILIVHAQEYYRTQLHTTNRLKALRLLIRTRLIGAHAQVTATPPNYHRAITLCDVRAICDSYSPPVGAELLWHISGYDLVLCRLLAGTGESQQNFVIAARASEYFTTTDDLDAAARARLLSTVIGTRLALPNPGRGELARVADRLGSDARLATLAQQVLDNDPVHSKLPAGVTGPTPAPVQFTAIDFMHFHESRHRPE